MWMEPPHGGSAVVESRAVLPDSLEPECFFGRIEEFRRLDREARLLARGSGRSRVLCARPGSGKTELLRQWHSRVFHEGHIFPFWHSLPREIGDTADLAFGFVASLALQALAFKRRDPGLLVRTLTNEQLAGALRSTWGAAGVMLAESLLEPGRRGSHPGALAKAALVPHRLAALSGTRVLCLIDDIGNLAAARQEVLWPEAATGSPIAPAIFTLDDESLMPQIFGPAGSSLVALDPLPPLSNEAASRLARHLSQSAGLDLDEQSLAALAAESAGSPFYLGALVRALVERPGGDLVEVARASAAALCHGELARYWIDRLAFAIPERRTRATALEILAFCIREGNASPAAGQLADLMLKPGPDVESALAGLMRAGVVRVDFNRIMVDGDPVFRDVVQALYRREFGRVAPAAIAASLASDKVLGPQSVQRRRRRESLHRAIGDLLGAWDGQKVPAHLFSAAASGVLHEGTGAEDVVADRGGAAGLVTLPRIISVAAGRIGGDESLPGVELDALGWALHTDAESSDAAVVWAIRLLPGGSGSADQLTRFDRDVAALQAAGELPEAQPVRWALLESPLDGDGEMAAARLRLLTSTRPQFEALAKLIGVSTVLPLQDPVTSAGPELELEMVIPRAADIELVAARALEQLAEHLSIDAAVTGRLKVALVEACINAFEHGGSRDGRVRLMFTVAGRRLAMRVENRGRPLAGLPAPAAPGREAGGRGWGLTLIRELVDEVTLEPREDGVCLLMVTYLDRGKHG
jgi:anti-sigma regulatory factor (Ser/Thr protein kinase)